MPSKEPELDAREATVTGSDQHTRWRKVCVYGYVLNNSHKLQHDS